MKNKYDWVIVGGGISGISSAEILSREGLNVLVVEKDLSLASGATKDFHEWMHTGSLYTLNPDNLKAFRYLVGAMDDLIQYYSNFPNMNLSPTEKGLSILSTKEGWFNGDYVYYRYRLRKANPIWMYLVAKSILTIDKLKKHDWLRRRAGVVELFKPKALKCIFMMFKLYFYKDEFYTIKTPDFTINSRRLLDDFVSVIESRGSKFLLDSRVSSITNANGIYTVMVKNKKIKAENILLCNGNDIGRFCDVKIKTTYAPISVVKGIKKSTKSFVDLDCIVSNCINLIIKKSGLGLAGGISFSKKDECYPYLDKVIKSHKELNPGIQEISRYVGVKNEVIFKNQKRGYLYNIHQNKKGVWAIIPGKFTLSFSVSPEFYRKIYKKNPKLNIEKFSKNKKSIVALTHWQEELKNKGKTNGND